MKASLIDRLANLSIFTKFFLLIGAVVFINNFITFLGVYVAATETFRHLVPEDSIMNGGNEFEAYLPKSPSQFGNVLSSYLPFIARGFISLVGSLEWLGLAYTIELYFRIANKMPAYIKVRRARKLTK